MKKRILTIIILLLIALAAFFIYKSYRNSKEQETIIAHNMLVQRIEQLGRLEVIRYNIQDLMDFEKKRDWLPNSKISVKIVGEVTGCVDLAKITSEDIFVDKDSVSLILPDPEICNWKIDHSKSKVYNVKYGLWETENLVDESYKEAEQKLYKEARNMGIVKESRESARKVLTPILRGLGFKRVFIGFKSDKKDGSTPTIEITKEY